MLGACLLGYVIGLYLLAFRLRDRIRGIEDFIVAGRRLGLPLATATLVGTWFGAGTILASADEVRRAGLERAALEPFGAGFCLIVAGAFFARPLWEMKLLTVSDFFRRKFDKRAEIVSAAVMVPSYFGWIAAQFVALAGMLSLFFDLDMKVGIVLVATVAVGYTLLGGMWSVTVTDAFQIALVFVGLVALSTSTLSTLGDGSAAAGLARLWTETPPELRRVVPLGSQPVLEWLALFAVGALGNIPGQDLMQRVFSARSSAVAVKACVGAGVLYVSFGLIPVTLGLAGRILFSDSLERAILPAMAQAFLDPVPAIVFSVVLVSAVLSTIDSAILSPASVLSQNVLEYVNRGFFTPLTLTRIAVVIVATGSLGFAFAGESAYALLEDAYELPLVGLFVPLVMGLYRPVTSPLPALYSMIAGAGLWAVHYALDWTHFAEPLTVSWPIQLPSSISLAALSFFVYIGVQASVGSSKS